MSWNPLIKLFSIKIVAKGACDLSYFVRKQWPISTCARRALGQWKKKSFFISNWFLLVPIKKHVRRPTFILAICIFSREIWFLSLFFLWSSNFSQQRKKFDSNGKCSDINFISKWVDLKFCSSSNQKKLQDCLVCCRDGTYDHN